MMMQKIRNPWTMELPHSALMEDFDFLPPRTDFGSSYSTTLNGSTFPSDGWSFVSSVENPVSLSNTDFLCYQTPSDPIYTFPDGLAVSELDSSFMVDNGGGPLPFLVQEDHPSVIEDEGCELFGKENQSSEEFNNGGRREVEVGLNGKRSKTKKIEGQPSKNLMAERRRRKRLNDRLSMLRSIVPKITKMDRTSILGDAIDYMRLLLQKINEMKDGEDEDVDLHPDEVAVARSSPKFEVEKKESETRIHVCCASRPGLLLSTLSTLEAFGLEIQHCVISCFNDFSVQASCSQFGDPQAASVVSSDDDVTQALFRTSGYGGRYL